MEHRLRDSLFVLEHGYVSIEIGGAGKLADGAFLWAEKRPFFIWDFGFRGVALRRGSEGQFAERKKRTRWTQPLAALSKLLRSNRRDHFPALFGYRVTRRRRRPVSSFLSTKPRAECGGNERTTRSCSEQVLRGTFLVRPIGPMVTIMSGFIWSSEVSSLLFGFMQCCCPERSPTVHVSVLRFPFLSMFYIPSNSDTWIFFSFFHSFIHLLIQCKPYIGKWINSYLSQTAALLIWNKIKTQGKFKIDRSICQPNQCWDNCNVPCNGCIMFQLCEFSNEWEAKWTDKELIRIYAAFSCQSFFHFDLCTFCPLFAMTCHCGKSLVSHSVHFGVTTRVHKVRYYLLNPNADSTAQWTTGANYTCAWSTGAEITNRHMRLIQA